MNDCFYGVNEKCLNYDNRCFYVDFLYKNKIIEFYGDYFHGNPKMYEYSQIIGSKYKKTTVAEKWKYDNDREEILKKNGYDVLIVWENDYKQNKKIIIEKCKKWIKNL